MLGYRYIVKYLLPALMCLEICALPIEIMYTLCVCIHVCSYNLGYSCLLTYYCTWVILSLSLSLSHSHTHTHRSRQQDQTRLMRYVCILCCVYYNRLIHTVSYSATDHSHGQDGYSPQSGPLSNR